MFSKNLTTELTLPLEKLITMFQFEFISLGENIGESIEGYFNRAHNEALLPLLPCGSNRACGLNYMWPI